MILLFLAHKTTTHAGLGANTAFQDAVDLANAIREIAEKKATLNDRLIAYEKVSCVQMYIHISNINIYHSSRRLFVNEVLGLFECRQAIRLEYTRPTA